MFDVVPGDTVKPYALICNGHDGSLAITIGATGVRVVCANTQRQALSDSKSGFLKIRHSKGSLKGKIEEARRKLGMAAEAMDVYAEEAKALAKVQMGSNQVKEYFTEFFPVEVKPKLEGVNGAQVLDAILTAKGTEKEVMAELLSGHYAETERIAKRNSKILDQLLENFEDKTNTIPGMAGTAWAALNSVSEYVDHQKEYRSADSRLSNVWFGSGDQLKQEAFASAKALANA
jgi:phage/plasmid-like protein (TIGR03299 family)